MGIKCGQWGLRGAGLTIFFLRKKVGQQTKFLTFFMPPVAFLSTRSFRPSPLRSPFQHIIRRTMKAYIQFLGQSSVEGPPTIVVHYDTQRYMFNCREGTQRLFVEERVRMSKLRDIYLTRVQWQTIGGLPGMLLTLADAGVKDLSLHGTKNLTHFMCATRQFVYR